MCQKCVAKEAARKAAALFGMEIQEVPQGTATIEAVKQLDAAQQELTAIVTEMQKFAEESANAARQRMDQLFTERYKEAEDRHLQAFNNALASAGIDISKRAGDYTVNHETGEVTIEKIVPMVKNNPPIAAGVH